MKIIASSMAKGEVKNSGKKSKVTLLSVSKEVSGLKEWREGVDKEIGGLKKWRERVDNNLGSLNKEVGGLKEWRESTDKWKRNVSTILAITQEEIREIKANMYTKKDHSKWMIYMDTVMGEVRASRQERELYADRFLKMDDRIVDHERRLKSLENVKN